MSAEFRQSSHRESGDEIIPVPGEQETLQENNLPEHEFKSTTEYLTLRNRAWAKCKKTMLFLVPIFASQIVNVIAGFFYTSFMFVDKPRFGETFFGENGEMVAKEQRIFRVSFALAAASCAPLLVRFSARKIVQWGSVLLILSCILLSLTTTGDVMTILLSITGGFTGGLLRTTGVVSTVDHLNTRPALALIISYISFHIGKVINVSFSFYISLVHRGRDWLHVTRVFEITGVIGLLAGIFLQKNSQAQQNVTRFFKHPPIYFLILITVPASMGLSILSNTSNFKPLIGPFVSLLVLIVLLIIPGKQRSLNKNSALLSMGISVLAVGFLTMVIFGLAQDVGASYLLGAATGVLHQVLMPLVLINTTGRSNIKLALPVLVCFGDVGGLIGISIMENQSHRVALYSAGASLIIAGVGAIIAWVLIKRWPPLSDDNFFRAIAICAETTGEAETENVVVECVEDRVEEEEADDNPGEEEADNPGEEEAEEPGQEEAEEPGQEEAEEPGQEEAEEPGQEEADNPGQEEADNPGQEEADNPGQDEAEEPGEQEAEEPGQEEADNPGEEEADNPGQDEAEEPGEQEAEEPGEEEAEEPGQEEADNPGEEEADNPGQEEADNPGEEEADNPGEQEAEEPGQEEAEEPGQEEAEEPGEEEAEEPGEEEADNPGEQEAEEPGQEEAEEPGQEEAEEPGQEEAEEPGQEEAEVPVEDLREEESENSGLTGVAPVDC